MSSAYSFKAVWLLFFLLCLVESYEWREEAAKVSALYVFGDSTVDPGNNNHLPTIAKANFPPYGRDFTAHKPTGRFSNGKIATDFIAAGLGLKETLPAYLDPTLTTQDFITGVSFASAGTGYDNLTAETINVLPLWKQVDNFKHYLWRLRKLVGEEKASDIIANALFYTSIGTNDLVFTYLDFPTIRKLQFTIEQYGDFLQQEAANFVQKLAKAGARRLLMVGLPGIGCLPAVKTLRKSSKCLEGQNQAAIDFNEKTRQMLARVQPLVPQLKLLYSDLYTVSMDFFQNPHKYGFETSERGCCGTGLIEVGPLCNAQSHSCADASKYVFWDAVHPSERAHEIVAKLMLERDISGLL